MRWKEEESERELRASEREVVVEKVATPGGGKSTTRCTSWGGKAKRRCAQSVNDANASTTKDKLINVNHHNWS